MPSAYAATGATSPRSWQPSSTITGSRGCSSRRLRNETRSAAGNGCSTNSTPIRISSGISSRAESSVQPSLASTRRGTSDSSRTASSRSRSSAPPTLTFSARNSLARAVDRVDRDRVGGRRSLGRQAEQAPDRHAEALADPVVERRVEGGLAGGLAINVLEPLLDRLERERVVAHERRRRGCEELGRGVDRLAAVVDGRRLAAPDDAVVLELDLDERLARPRAARDAELLGQGERCGCGAEH